MNFVEIVRGIGNIVFIMVVAGAVAYVGDRVGHQVGRKRLSLLGLRPRYTSTIIAIGTGMLIALVVTSVAILASQQVKTAFFKLNSLNQEISALQTREGELEDKVNNGRLVVPTDTLMVPFYRIIDQAASPAQRLATIREFYFSGVKFINSTYPRLGLPPYEVPRDIDKVLAAQADAFRVRPGLADANVMLTISSYQNLYANDQIHFQLNGTPDVRVFEKDQLIAQLSIPGKSGASANIALSELQRDTSTKARILNMPDFLAENVQTLQLIPSLAQMQTMIAKPGTYLLNAYATEDVYPHTGGIPIVIVLAQQPGAVNQAVIGVDPGRSKAGYALLDPAGSVIAAGVVPIEDLYERLREVIGEAPIGALAVGRGTNGRAIASSLEPLELPLVWVDEFETTREARGLYFADHPPRGWRRLIPLGLQLPPRPVDDYAAIAIARRYLAARSQ